MSLLHSCSSRAHCFRYLPAIATTPPPFLSQHRTLPSSTFVHDKVTVAVASRSKPLLVSTITSAAEVDEREEEKRGGPGEEAEEEEEEEEEEEDEGEEHVHMQRLEKLLRSFRSSLPSGNSSFEYEKRSQNLAENMFSPRVRGILLLNLLTILYGSNIPIIKEVEMTTDPWLFTCGRFMLATILFLPYVLRGVKDAEVKYAGLELGLWISSAYLTQSISLLTSDAGHASFISAFTVIAVPILAGFSGKRISSLTWGSSAAAFIGIGFLENSGSPATIGDVWSFCSAVLFGVHMLRTEHYVRTIRSEKSLPLLGTQLLVISVSSLLCSLLFNKGILFELRGSSMMAVWQSIASLPWLPMLYTGVFSTALCLWIEMTAMRDISAVDTAVIFCLEPLWGAAFAWCLLGERWGLKGWIGAMLILGGSLTVQLVKPHQDEEEAAATDELRKLEE